MTTAAIIYLLYLLTSTSTDAKHGLKIRKENKLTQPCDQAVYTGNVLENSLPGTFILRVSANTLPLRKPIWSISKTVREFTINSDTGDIFVSSTLRRTRAKKFGFTVEFDVVATDREKVCESSVRVNIIPTSTSVIENQKENATVANRQIVIIDDGTSTVIDASGSAYGQQAIQLLEPPTQSIIFSQSSYQFTVLSCLPGAFVGQTIIESTTPSPITFSILNLNVFFVISPQTGIITVQNIPPVGFQTLLVSAQTVAGQVLTVPVSINSPCTGLTGVIPNGLYTAGLFGDTVAFAQPSYQFFSTACTAGAVIGQVLAQANGQTVTYSIPAGNAFFAISSISGVLSTTLPPPGGGTWSQTFTVAATSATGRTTSVAVTISNTCLNPGGFAQSAYNFQLTSCAIGQVVGSVFSSPGVTGGVAYSIPNGSPYFAVSVSTGQLTVIQPPPIGMQSFTVQSLSSGGQTSTAAVTVNITPGPPTFPGTFYQFTVMNCLGGASVGQVSATSCGGSVTYSLTGNGDPYYTIDQLTGQLSLLTVPQPGTHNLQVQAISSNGQSATVPVVISSSCGQYAPYAYYPQQQSNALTYAGGSSNNYYPNSYYNQYPVAGNSGNSYRHHYGHVLYV